MGAWLRFTWKQLENSVEADPMFSKVQGQLTCVEQEARLQFVHETGQRPEERIATLGLVPRHRVDSREQVAESFCTPGVFLLNWIRSPFLAGCAWPSKGTSLR